MVTDMSRDGDYGRTYLETGTLISQFSDSVEDKVDDFLTNGVVTSGVVIGGIFFTGNQLFRVEKLTVGTGSDLKTDYKNCF